MKNIWPTVEKNIKSAIYRRCGKVEGYQPTAAEVMEDKGVGSGDKKTNPPKVGDTPDRSPRKPGESYSDYLRRTKK